MDLSHPSPEILTLLATSPVLPPPHGVTSDFVNPPSRAGIQLAVSSTVLAFALLFLINRFYLKLFLQKRVTWDDATILLGMLGCVAYFIACTWGAKHGIGKHYWDISLLQAMDLNVLIPSRLISVLTPLTFLFLKSTFFILYLQLFEQNRWLRVVIWVGLLFNSVTYLLFTTLVFIFTTPSKGESWFGHLRSDNLKKTLAMSVPQSAVGLGIDLCILIIPMIAVSELTMSLKKKIGVILIFVSGALACICSACEIYYRVLLDRNPDTFWVLVSANISTMCEMFVGIICACIPSAAYAARRKTSTYKKVLHVVASSFRLFRSSRNDLSSTSQTHNTQTPPEPNVLKSTDRKYAEYFNLTDFLTATENTTTCSQISPEAESKSFGSGDHASSQC